MDPLPLLQQTCGNCSLTTDHSWHKSYHLPMALCQANAPMCLSQYLRPAVILNADASNCPCWEKRP